MSHAIAALGIACSLTVVATMLIGIFKARGKDSGSVAASLRWYRIAATAAASALVLELFDWNWLSLADAATLLATSGNVYFARKRLAAVVETEKLRAERLAREHDLPWVK